MQNRRADASFVAGIVTLALGLAIPVAAHEGHDHAAPPGAAEATAPAPVVELPDAAIANLGVQTVRAALAPRAQSLDLHATVSFLPEHHARISPRVSGKVASILVKTGDKVRAGQPLLTVQPNLIGSPPVTLAAPIEGFVTRHAVVLGESVQPETTLMEVADPDKVLVNGKVFETPEMARLAVGQKVVARAPVYGATAFEGRLQRVDIALQGPNRTLDVYALVDNPDHRLKAGMQAILSVELETPRDALAIPSRAILGEMGNLFVFVRDGNRFERRAVTLGARFGAEREILDGVLPDEDVVTQGHYQIQFVRAAPPPAGQAR